MRNNFKRLLPVLCAGMLIYGGCSKQQTVKVDQALAPSATASAAASAAKPEAGGATLKGEASAEPAGAPSQALAAATHPEAAPQPATADAAQGLEKVYFDFDSFTLNDKARAALSGNFEKLQATPQALLRIEGHCDERGSDEYNMALSESRARAARNYLEALGIPSARMSAVGYGEEKPAVPGEGEEAWAGNRRDEFIITK